ncbi:hypothetical protein SVIOM342S_06358 [Streptomyces violaceorubidus]
MRPAPLAAARLRALVLLLALLVPCAHVTVQAAPVTVAGSVAGEYDHLDSALRFTARSGRREAVVRPVPPYEGTPPPPRFHARSERAAVLPGGPRSVVLRC